MHHLYRKKIELEIFGFLFVHSRRQEGKSDTIFGREMKDQNLNILLYLLRLNLLCINFYCIACQLLFDPNNFHPYILQFSQTKREYNPVIVREMHGTLMIYLLTIFAGGWGWDADILPFLLSAWFWAGVCPADRVGRQTTQSGSTRTPSPAVAVVAAVGSTYRADATHLPGSSQPSRLTCSRIAGATARPGSPTLCGVRGAT